MVTGNTKIDAALSRPGDIEARELLDTLGLDRDSRILVAGSVHPGETEIVLEAYRLLLSQYPHLKLIIAPRHVEKTPLVLKAVKEAGLDPPDLFSSLANKESTRRSPIIVVDIIGKLFQLYSIATVVFVGGSLVNRGGQNILEPASWGKMVLFGPSMEDFREARDSLKAVLAGLEVRDADDIASAVGDVLDDEQKAREIGERGRQAIMAHWGSSEKTAIILSALL
jgi:3-deoxy-D-manno-octulosonic-acid transferase